MNYIKDLNMNATHIAQIKQSFNINGNGELRCIIPVLMPNIPKSGDLTLSTRISKANLLNRSKSSIKSKSTITTTNFMNIVVPVWIRRLFPCDIHGMVTTDRKIMITFIGGDINHIKVIGRYE